MIELIEAHRDELATLCRKYRVARLELFGSAARGGFDPHRSDLDLLVEFLPDSPMGPFRQYVDFLLELRDLFGCNVDLVEAGAMKNPYFIRSVNASRMVLYAA
jgi:predicted nucleotidyltransferase